MNKIISLESVIELHKLSVDKYGGIHGILNRNMLESAYYAPFMTAFGEEIYKTIVEKAVRLCYGLTVNHPFNDGNKRIGMLCLEFMLLMNGYELVAEENELIDISLKLSAGKYEYEKFLEIISKFIIKI